MKGSGKKIFHLQVVGMYSPMYWLHIEIPATATLEDLDRFLRAIWLECCGHLSSFEIAGETFASEATAARRPKHEYRPGEGDGTGHEV